MHCETTTVASIVHGWDQYKRMYTAYECVIFFSFSDGQQSSQGSQHHQTLPPEGSTFARITLGQALTSKVPPYGYWNVQFYVVQAGFVEMNFSIARGSSFAVYARKNALPTHTQYDLLEILRGFRARETRDLPPVSVLTAQFSSSLHLFCIRIRNSLHV